MIDDIAANLRAAGLPAPSGNVYCIGRNYAKHAKELGNQVPGEPVVFLKAPSALRPLACGPLAFEGDEFHHEAELVLLIGQRAGLGETVGWERVAGLTLGLDLTRRAAQNELKEKGLPWTIAKSFAGAGLVGDFVALAPDHTRSPILFDLVVNGEVRQRGDTSHMLFPVPRILTYLASFNELSPGDLVFTGTPEGVGPIRKGDTFELRSASLGLNLRGRL